MDKDSKTLLIKVRSADKLHYEGEALSLTSVNDKGPFDILPHHANFISLIQKNLIIHGSAGKWVKIDLQNGILRFHNGKADVFLGVGA